MNLIRMLSKVLQMIDLVSVPVLLLLIIFLHLYHLSPSCPMGISWKIEGRKKKRNLETFFHIDAMSKILIINS